MNLLKSSWLVFGQNFSDGFVDFVDLPHPKPLDYTYHTPEENRNRANPQIRNTWMFGKEDIYESLFLLIYWGPICEDIEYDLCKRTCN